jgi:hypothetical protein
LVLATMLKLPLAETLPYAKPIADG